MPIRDIGVVGDDPLVEIVMARRAGARSFGVTTGVTGLEAWQGQLGGPLTPRRARCGTEAVERDENDEGLLFAFV